MRLIVLLCIAFLSLSAIQHPIHISYTGISIKEDRTTILVKMFSDDLLLSVQQFRQKQNLNQEDYSLYFNEVLSLQQNNKKAKLMLDSVLIKEDAHWFYLQTQLQANKKIVMKNAILCNVYEDQKNLCILSVNDKESGYSFDFETRKLTLD